MNCRATNSAAAPKKRGFSKIHCRHGATLIVFALAGSFANPALAVLQTATYSGPNNGLWSVPGNWSGGVVPSNNIDTYQVIIPTNIAVQFDVVGATNITKLTLNTGATLKPLLNADLTVIDD